MFLIFVILFLSVVPRSFSQPDVVAPQIISQITTQTKDDLIIMKNKDFKTSLNVGESLTFFYQLDKNFQNQIKNLTLSWDTWPVLNNNNKLCWGQAKLFFGINVSSRGGRDGDREENREGDREEEGTRKKREKGQRRLTWPKKNLQNKLRASDLVQEEFYFYGYLPTKMTSDKITIYDNFYFKVVVESSDCRPDIDTSQNNGPDNPLLFKDDTYIYRGEYFYKPKSLTFYYDVDLYDNEGMKIY